MKLIKTVVVVGVVSLGVFCGTRGWARVAPGDEALMGVNTDPQQPWGLETPALQIPPTPVGWDLSRPKALRAHAPVLIRNSAELAAQAKPGGVIAKGAGTPGDPYIIENWHFTEFYTNPPQPWVSGQLIIQNCRQSILIRNCFFEGQAVTPDLPSGKSGLSLHDSANITVSRCRATRCLGFLAGACTNTVFEDCRAYSCTYGIFTSAGHHNRATRCYVNDTTEIGIFLYNGPDNVTEDCYVHDTGREGIGTNGQGQRDVFRNNVVFNCGWNGINMEGDGLDHVIEGNLVANSHYGILSMGSNGVVRNNRIFNCTQNGIILMGAPGDLVVSNLIVNSYQDGIWMFNGCSGVTLAGNTIIGAGNGIRLESKGSTGGCRVTGNTFSRFMSGVVLGAEGGQGAVVDGNRFSGGRNAITASKVGGVKITNNRFTHTLHGLAVGELTAGLVRSNRFDFVGMTMVLTACRDCLIAGNTSRMSYYNGILLGDSTGCTISANSILGSRTQAIRVDGGNGNVIEGNRISGAGGRGASDTGGILLKKAAGCRIAANRIEDSNVAIRFREDCKGNTLAGNTYAGCPVKVQIPAFEQPGNDLDGEPDVDVIPDDKRAANELPPLAKP